MKKSTKGYLILLTPFVTGFLFGLLVGGGCRHDAPEKDRAVPEVPELTESIEEAAADESEAVDTTVREIIYYAPRISYSKQFADINDRHIEAAERLGLPSVPRSRSDISSKSLVRISDCDLYVVDNLRYSVPYLTRGGEKELGNIARAFRDSLKRKELLDYKLVVSSVLRTGEDVTRLRRSGNPNASEKSAHCYGTTFDITYTRYSREDESREFMQPYELTKVLAEVLRDEQKAGRCLVKYERKEHCFHITSLLPR